MEKNEHLIEFVKSTQKATEELLKSGIEIGEAMTEIVLVCTTNLAIATQELDDDDLNEFFKSVFEEIKRKRNIANQFFDKMRPSNDN